ncbi:hypothetical protein NCG89_16555 [Spongiibacter taiwanensis]|uniref:hypothetical protein n=1 Tax=Spongiibacter taiwanensis TaxID=1748242 RepID=UPI002035097E|nr:hypothetical protein [Spongiibacter taiwanensis]USA43134.1 hypothetical protein NCG89_16555 [Spongiibacter taiwanensis]
MKLKIASILLAGFFAAGVANAHGDRDYRRYDHRWDTGHHHKHHKFKHQYRHAPRHHYGDHVYYEAPGRYYRYHEHSRYCGHRHSTGRIRVYIGL